MADQSKEQRLGGVSWNDDAAIHTAAQEPGARSEAEVTAMVFAAVAAIAVGLEDGLDALRVERDGVGSRSTLCGDPVWLP